VLLSTVRDFAPEDKAALPFAFEVFSAHRPSVLLQGVSAADRDSWAAALKACIQHALAAASAHPPTPTRRARTLAHPLPAACAQGLRVAAHADDDAAAAAALEAVGSSPGNGVCADCGAPGPEWASLNLGVLLCIECSGVHRSLGSHVSKVRSLTLDRVAATSARVLAAVGNARANAVWELAVLGETKPHAASPRAAKEAWIKAKCVRQTGVWKTTSANLVCSCFFFLLRDILVSLVFCRYLERRFLGTAATPQQLEASLSAAAARGDIAGVASALSAGPSAAAKAEALRLACSSPVPGLVSGAAASCVCELLVLNGADWRALGGLSGLSALQLAEAQGPASDIARTARAWADGS
jgi:hypothetical protein